VESQFVGVTLFKSKVNPPKAVTQEQELDVEFAPETELA
jgi:hypothetical protein